MSAVFLPHSRLLHQVETVNRRCMRRTAVPVDLLGSNIGARGDEQLDHTLVTVACCPH
jgi:hypothetical protein